MSVSARAISSLDFSYSHENEILATLPPDDRGLVFSHLVALRLRLNQVLYESGDTIKYVYFPRNAVISNLALLEDGTTVEVGMIGGLGIAGSAVLLGGQTSPHLTVVQISGEAYRIRADELLEICRRCSALNALLLRFCGALATQSCQRAACNCRHTNLQRLCAWLLLIDDCVRKTADLPLTQELISRRLGSRRASVTAAYNYLQGAGCVSYSRGRVRILDRNAIENVACECYSVISQENRQVLNPLSQRDNSAVHFKKVR